MVFGEGRTQALFERLDFLERVYRLLILGFVFTSRGLGENWRARSDKFLIDNRNYPPVLTYYGIWQWALQNGTFFWFVLIKTLHCSSLTDQAASSLQSWLLCCCKCWDNNILCCGQRRVEILSPQKPNRAKTWSCLSGLAVVGILRNLNPVILYTLLCVHLFSLARDARHCVLSCISFWLLTSTE